MKTLIYEHENKQHIKCHIYDCGDYYEIKTDRSSAKFSKNNRALSVVIDTINLYGNPQSSPKSRIGFVFRQRNKLDRSLKHIVQLSHVLLAAYTNQPVSYYKGKRLHYIDGNENNLRKENIRTVSNSSTTVIEVHGKKYTLVTTKAGVSVTDYFPELHKIIESISWEYNQHAKALRNKPFRKAPTFLHQLVWVYHNDGATFENWRDKIAEVCTGRNGVTIDHKKSGNSDNPRWDNRITNLQLLSGPLNSKKGNCTRALPNNTFYIPTANGETYGLYGPDNTMQVCAFEGAATNKSIEMLKHFCKTGTFHDDSAIHSYSFSSAEGSALLSNINHESIYYQEVLNKCLLKKK